MNRLWAWKSPPKTFSPDRPPVLSAMQSFSFGKMMRHGYTDFWIQELLVDMLLKILIVYLSLDVRVCLTYSIEPNNKINMSTLDELR